MTLTIVLGLASLAICGLLAGMETGIYTLNRVRLAVRVAQQHRSAKRLRAEIQHPSRLLATVLVGINLAHGGLSAATTHFVESITQDPFHIALINTSIVLPFVFFLGDAIPKELFRIFTNTWTYGCSSILLGLRVMLTWTGIVPIIRVLSDLLAHLLGCRSDQHGPTRQRILQSLRDGIESDHIKNVHLEMADRLFGLADRTVQECAIPWSRVTTISAEASAVSHATLFRESPFSYLPVVATNDGTVQIVGILSSLEAILKPNMHASALAQEALLVDSKTLVMEAARQMRAARRPLAVVCEAGSSVPIGIVTLKDLVEPILGATPSW
ncbi:MAG: DUF21 domain-containing protein [Phycisphaerales bacterium]|nr:DUF21 domain-containing protein [Phycisphaerales bacterium]